MSTNGRRLAWILIGALLLVVVAVVGFGIGVAAGHGGPAGGLVDGIPMRGFGVRYPAVGLLGLFVPLVLIGLGVAFVVLLIREPRHSAPPPTPRDSGDGVERLRELAAMHDQGRLTDEEFAAAKRKLLGL